MESIIMYYGASDSGNVVVVRRNSKEHEKSATIETQRHTKLPMTHKNVKSNNDSVHYKVTLLWDE